MTINRPGLPTDLPPAERLWARWALLAALRATAEAEARPSVHRRGRWIDEVGLHWDDSGCTWWIFESLGEGRFVLYGEDESSAVKWYEPAIDVLAGGPDWLPYAELRERIAGWEIGCVYWYENGAWARAPYPEDLDDDGLDCGIGEFADRDDVLRTVRFNLADRTDAEGAERFLADAESYRLDPAALPAALGATNGDGDPIDQPAVLRALTRAGLAGAAGQAEARAQGPAPIGE
ncbi:hypothetical protein ACIRBX_03290 [Kitasatospora sp. NPDC096147]|uniref:hypothetical protein n=1 Tax=Kitasatospora sp. NPDC096147 TaxID=3364093 RepID=UPI0038155781